mgnify:CR=1 FL=1
MLSLTRLAWSIDYKLVDLICDIVPSHTKYECVNTIFNKFSIKNYECNNNLSFLGNKYLTSTLF